MYQRKLKFERERYLNLQQKNLEQKNTYEQVLLDLEVKYQKDIQSVREEYATQLRMEHSHMQKHKEGHLSEKKRMEMQFMDFEEETDYTINEIQMSKD